MPTGYANPAQMSWHDGTMIGGDQPGSKAGLVPQGKIAALWVDCIKPPLTTDPIPQALYG
jgi:hypothetical protein